MAVNQSSFIIILLYNTLPVFVDKEAHKAQTILWDSSFKGIMLQENYYLRP